MWGPSAYPARRSPTFLGEELRDGEAWGRILGIPGPPRVPSLLGVMEGAGGRRGGRLRRFPSNGRATETGD